MHVRIPFFIRSSEQVTFNGAALILEGTNASLEVLMRHVELGGYFGKVAAEFLNFGNDFIVVVATGLFVEGFFVHVESCFEFLTLVPAALYAPYIGPVSG